MQETGAAAQRGKERTAAAADELPLGRARQRALGRSLGPCRTTAAAAVRAGPGVDAIAIRRAATGVAPPAMAQPMAPLAMPGASSGFLRQAATTAAGIAGGALLFQGISSLFGPHYGGGFLSGMPQQPGLGETVINNYYDTPAPGRAGHAAGGYRLEQRPRLQ